MNDFVFNIPNHLYKSISPECYIISYLCFRVASHNNLICIVQISCTEFVHRFLSTKRVKEKCKSTPSRAFSVRHVLCQYRTCWISWSQHLRSAVWYRNAAKSVAHFSAVRLRTFFFPLAILFCIRRLLCWIWRPTGGTVRKTRREGMPYDVHAGENPADAFFTDSPFLDGGNLGYLWARVI